MGIRGELYSNRISVEGRTYFFNVKENRMGDIFLNIVESKPSEGESFDRRSIVVFKEDMKEFLLALDGALKHMEAAKGARPRTGRKVIREGMVEGGYRDIDEEELRSNRPDGRPAPRPDRQDGARTAAARPGRERTSSERDADRPRAGTADRRPVGRPFGRTADRPGERSASHPFARSVGRRDEHRETGRPYRGARRDDDDRRPSVGHDGEGRPAPRMHDENRPAPRRSEEGRERRVSLIGGDAPKRRTYVKKPEGVKPHRKGSSSPGAAGKRVVVRKKKGPEGSGDGFIGD